MSPVARSAAGMAAYLFALSLVMIAVPDTFIDLAQLPPTPDLYVRVLAVLAAAIGTYFAFAARDDNRAFLGASVLVRTGVFVLFTLIALSAGEPMLILFGAVDVAFAAWTWSTLRST